MPRHSLFLVGLVASSVFVAGFSVRNAEAQLPQRIITTDAASATSVFAADLDGDGDNDVLSASLADDKIAWYENTETTDGDGFDSQRVITTAAEWAQDVHAADLDGDGNADVLSASSFDDRVAWYENQIGEVGADTDGFGSLQTITSSAAGAQSVYTADIDGDGDRDVLAAASGGDKVAWYENQIGEAGADTDGFGSEKVITTDAKTVYSVFATDLDGDGDVEVLSASSFDNKVAWYENQIGEAGADSDGFGAPQVITDQAEGAVSVYATDLDGDGDSDVVSASSYDDRVAWYENQIGEAGADSDGFGPLQTITTGAAYVASVYAADLDNDADVDVLSASRSDDQIAWYENQIGEGGSDGDGFGVQKTITTDADEAQSVYAADVSGDGHIDVLSASTNDDKIAWYANTAGALPVELVAFEGRQTGSGAVVLTWQTASEARNARFEVQRREKGDRSGTERWTTIGRVRGSGTTARPQTYRYTDTSPPFAADSLSYRLRQVDVDGTAHFLETLTIVRDVRSVQLGPVYPSPAQTRVTVRVATPERRGVVLRVHDVLGREVRTVSVPGVQGRQEIQLDVSGLPGGTYFLYLTAGKTSRTTRLTVIQ